MARTVFKTQRDSSQLRLLIDSHEPFPNYDIEVALENICDTLNNDGAGTPAGHVRRVCRLSHEISLYSQSGSPAVLNLTIARGHLCSRVITPTRAMGCTPEKEDIRITSNQCGNLNA